MPLRVSYACVNKLIVLSLLIQVAVTRLGLGMWQTITILQCPPRQTLLPWGFVNAVGCVVAMEAVRSRAWAGVFVWFGAAAAWNSFLFWPRPPSRRAKVA